MFICFNKENTILLKSFLRRIDDIFLIMQQGAI